MGLTSRGIIFYYYFLKTKVNIICFVILSSEKLGRSVNGTHAAPRRQVST
jgi:hypothetical protein